MFEAREGKTRSWIENANVSADLLAIKVFSNREPHAFNFARVAALTNLLASADFIATTFAGLFSRSSHVQPTNTDGAPTFFASATTS